MADVRSVPGAICHSREDLGGSEVRMFGLPHLTLARRWCPLSTIRPTDAPDCGYALGGLAGQARGFGRVPEARNMRQLFSLWHIPVID